MTGPPQARRSPQARRRPRTIVDGWAVAGCQAGCGLAVCLVLLGSVVGVVAGIAGSAVSGTLDSSMRSTAGVAFVLVAALPVAAVTGALAGLVIGIADGLALRTLSRTDGFRSATPADQQRRVTLTAVASTALGGLAVQWPLLGLAPSWPWIPVTFLPTIAGTLVAVCLSRRLPPARQSRSGT